MLRLHALGSKGPKRLNVRRYGRDDVKIYSGVRDPVEPNGLFLKQRSEVIKWKTEVGNAQ